MAGAISGLSVTVVGAGVAGLAVALALAQRGAEVQVLEQAPAIKEVGAGIQISANGAAVMRALGLEDALVAAAVRGQGVSLFDGLSGRRVVHLDLATIKPDHRPYYVHRADLTRVLHSASLAVGVRIVPGAKVVQVDLASARPSLFLSDGTTQGCTVLIGADGLKSVVHHTLNGVVAPWFTRQAAWRAIIPGRTDDVPGAEVHMGPGRHLVSYPLRGGALRNIVAVEERGAWLAEGWSHRDDPAHLQTAFAGFSPRVRGWLDQVTETGLWGLYRHPVARHWARSLPQGAVALLGDSAHPTLPFLAQGANMALEDAFVLAAVLDSHGITPAAMSIYQDRRAPRCQRIVAASGGMARIYHLRRPWRGPAYAALAVVGKIAPGRMIARQDWIWGHNVTTEADQALSVSQTGT